MLISFLLRECPEVRQLDITNSIFLLLKSLHIVLHNGYANFHSYQQCMGILFFSHQHLLFLVFSFHFDNSQGQILSKVS